MALKKTSEYKALNAEKLSNKLWYIRQKAEKKALKIIMHTWERKIIIW